MNMTAMILRLTTADDTTAIAATMASRAATNASIMSKAYEKFVCSPFPSSGEMANWTIALGLACVCSGGFSDELEVAWLAKCSSKSFEQLPASYWSSPTPAEPNETADIDIWRKLVFARSQAVHGILKQIKESLTE